MKLGKLGLFFILSATAVVAVFGDLLSFKIDASAEKELTLDIGGNKFTVKSDAEGECGKLKDALLARKGGVFQLKEAPSAKLPATLTFADGNVLKFADVGADNKLTVTVEQKNDLVAGGAVSKDAEGDIVLKDGEIKFGDIAITASPAIAKDLKDTNAFGTQRALDCTAGADAWVKGSAGKVTFHVIRKNDKAYVLSHAQSKGLGDYLGHPWMGVAIFLPVFAGLFFALNFVLRSVDEDLVNEGVSGSSIMPQTIKDALTSESTRPDVVADELLDEIDEEGKVIPRGERSGKADIGLKQVEDKETGTVEISLAAAFLLPFLL